MSAKIWYLDNNGVFQSSENSTIIQLYDMLQRIQTFKGEQSFNASNGVDYLAVFNRQAFLKPQIEAIQADYTPYFNISNEIITTQEKATVNMLVTFQNGQTATLTAIIGG